MQRIKQKKKGRDELIIIGIISIIIIIIIVTEVSKAVGVHGENLQLFLKNDPKLHACVT